MARTWVGPDSNGHKPEDNNGTSKCFQAQLQTWLVSPICWIQPTHSSSACLLDLSSAPLLKHPYIFKKTQTKLWWSTLLSPENRTHTQRHDIAPKCAMGSLLLPSHQGKADGAPTLAIGGDGVVALSWATIVHPALTSANLGKLQSSGHGEFYPFCQY